MARNPHQFLCACYHQTKNRGCHRGPRNKVWGRGMRYLACVAAIAFVGGCTTAPKVADTPPPTPQAVTTPPPIVVFERHKTHHVAATKKSRKIETAAAPKAANGQPAAKLSAAPQKTFAQAKPSPNNMSAHADGMRSVRLEFFQGKYVVNAVINGETSLPFVVDMSATDVFIPASVVHALVTSGAISRSDFIGGKDASQQKGSSTPAKFRIRSLTVGPVTLHNVLASVTQDRQDLQLGQSFLGRLKSWCVDNSAHALLIE